MSDSPTINDILDMGLEVRREWMCACSGDHPAGQPNTKCFRKGGYYVDCLYRPDSDEEVGMAFTISSAVEFVNRYHWQRTNVSVTCDGVPGTFLMRPDFVAATQ